MLSTFIVLLSSVAVALVLRTLIVSIPAGQVGHLALVMLALSRFNLLVVLVLQLRCL